jgi:hypothetical protein
VPDLREKISYERKKKPPERWRRARMNGARAWEVVYKRRTLAKFEAFRAREGMGGFGKISEASGWLLNNALLCAVLQREKMPMEKWHLLAQSLKKLEKEKENLLEGGRHGEKIQASALRQKKL